MALAVVTFTNSRPKLVAPEKGAAIWRAKTGLLKRMSRKQRRYISEVSAVFIPDSVAPADYLEAKQRRLAGQVTQLELTEPQPWYKNYDNM